MPLVQIAVIRRATAVQIKEGKPDCEVVVKPEWRVVKEDSLWKTRIYKELDLDTEDDRIEVLKGDPFQR
jgi:hypothetical protein